MAIRISGKYLYGLTPVLAVCLVVFALAPSLAFAGDRLERFDFELYSGYRTDKFDWNIANDLTGSSTPNILSELTCDDLDIFQFGIESSLRISNSHLPFLGLITGYINYGSIIAGGNQDSDYAGDNRTFEFSRSNNDSSDGDVWDVSLALGPEFVFYGQRLSLNPGRSLALSGRIEWHLGEYQAEADWNLRDEWKHPVSFSHFADDASGLVVRLGADLSMTDTVFFTTGGTYMKWQAEDGIDTIYLADNSINTTRLNEVNWESTGIVVGLTALLN